MRLKILGTTVEENPSWPKFFFRKEKGDRKKEDGQEGGSSMTLTKIKNKNLVS
jgi:hypothetical protein